MLARHVSQYELIVAYETHKRSSSWWQIDAIQSVSRLYLSNKTGLNAEAF